MGGGLWRLSTRGQQGTEADGLSQDLGEEGERRLEAEYEPPIVEGLLRTLSSWGLKTAFTLIKVCVCVCA